MMSHISDEHDETDSSGKRSFDSSSFEISKRSRSYITVPPDLTCRVINTNGCICNSTLIDKDTYLIFGEIVCKACKFDLDDYQLITRTEASTKYLVPDTTLKTLKHQPKINAHHPNWAPVQLFLRKHIKEAAICRFGSIEDLELEVQKRGEKKFQRDLIKLEDKLTSESNELKNQLNVVENSSTNDDTGGDSYDNSFNYVKTNSSNSIGGSSLSHNIAKATGIKGSLKGGKKKSNALLDMVKCIRG